jgi:hypothetical protein
METGCSLVDFNGIFRRYTESGIDIFEHYGKSPYRNECRELSLNLGGNTDNYSP